MTLRIIGLTVENHYRIFIRSKTFRSVKIFNDYKFRHLEKINFFHFSNSSPKDMGKVTNQGEVIS